MHLSRRTVHSSALKAAVHFTLSICGGCVLCVAQSGCMSKHSNSISSLAHHINEDADLLHAEYTPSVRELIRRGHCAIPYMLDLMINKDQETRLRAQTVIEGITLRDHGWIPGEGWPGPDMEKGYNSFWRSLGNLQFDSDPSARLRSVAMWRRWYANLSER